MRDDNEQENAGHGAIQIFGSYNTINYNQHMHMEVPAFALQAPPAPQARFRQRNQQITQPITPAQKDLLAMMRPLPRAVRNGLLEWMRCEFGTGLVMELEPGELQRARQRVLAARRLAGI